MEDITLEQLQDLQEPFYHYGLINAHAPNKHDVVTIHELFPHANAIEVSSVVSTGCGRAAVGDVVAAIIDGEMQVGELLLNFSVDGSCYSIVAMWERVADGAGNRSWAKFEVAHVPSLIHSMDIDCALTVALTGDKRFAHALLFPWLR